MDINIAAMVKPKKVEGFFNAVRESFPEISSGVIATGYGCNNFGFRIVSDDEQAEQIANRLTMALMPARWSRCVGDDMIKEGEFYDARGE